MQASLLLLLVAMLSIQTGAGFAKSLFPLAGAAGATGLRLFFAAVILMIIFRPWRHHFSKKSLKLLGVYGVSLGVMNLTFYFSLERIPLGIAVSLEFVGPLVLALGLSRKPVDFLWAFLAAIGIWFVMPNRNTAEALDLVGVFFALFAGAAWAFYIYFGQKAGKDLHGGAAVAVGTAIAAFVATPVALFLDADRIFSPAHILTIIPAGIAVAILASALPYTLEMLAMKKIPAKTFGILMSAEPAVASLIGLAILGEKLLALQWVAIVFIVGASLGSAITATQPHAEPH